MLAAIRPRLLTIAFLETVSELALVLASIKAVYHTLAISLTVNKVAFEQIAT